MTLNKKLWFKLSLLALVLALGAACDETEVPEAETPTTTTTTYAAAKMDSIVGTAFGPVAHMAKSLNGSTLYVAEDANDSLYAIAGAAPVKLGTKSDALDGSVGKAKLNAIGNAKVTHLSPSATGVLATLDGKHVALYNGTTAAPTNAWTYANAGGTHFGPFVNDANTIKAFMVNNKLYVREFQNAAARFLAGPGGAAIIGNVVSSAALAFSAGEPVFMASTGGNAFIVETKGVYSLSADGAANNAVVAPAVPARAADWLVKGQPAGPLAAANSANTIPSCVLINNNKLYVGFTKTGNINGGVAIYNLDPGTHAITTFVPTSFTSRDTSVVALTAHGNDVYAVLAGKILKVVETTGEDQTAANVGPEVALVGDLSAYYGANKADGSAAFTGTELGNFKAAEFMGDDLYVGTSTGLYKFTKTTVTK